MRPDFKMASNTSASNTFDPDPDHSGAAPAGDDLGRWLFEASLDSLHLLDGQGRLRRTNARGRQLLGGERPEDPRGLLWPALWPAGSRAQAAAAVEAARRGEPARFQAVWPVPHAAERWWDVVLRPVEYQGRIHQILAVMRDVTAARRAKQQFERARELIEEATRARQSFSRRLNQEVRSPAHAVAGLVRLLRTAPPGVALDQGLDRLEAASRQLFTVLDGVLDLCRAEEGTLRLDERDFELRKVVERIGVVLQPEASSQSVELHVDLAPGPAATFCGDPARLSQVVIAYARDALSAMRGGALRIAVRTSPEGTESVRLRVDLSAGAPDSARGAPLNTRMDGGGLGLELCERLVRLMGGQGGSASGDGTVFRWFTVPLRVHRSLQGAATAVFADPPAVLRGKRVLVVDDDPLCRDVAQGLLELAGAKVDTVGNGRLALQAIEAGAFDAVLMDLVMPVMGGLEATRAIRAQARHAHLPILVVSGNVRQEDREACRRAGASDFLAKPVDPPRLWFALAHWTSRAGRLGAPQAPARHGDEFYLPTVPGALA